MASVHSHRGNCQRLSAPCLANGINDISAQAAFHSICGSVLRGIGADKHFKWLRRLRADQWRHTIQAATRHAQHLAQNPFSIKIRVKIKLSVVIRLMAKLGRPRSPHMHRREPLVAGSPPDEDWWLGVHAHGLVDDARGEGQALELVHVRHPVPHHLVHLCSL